MIYKFIKYTIIKCFPSSTLDYLSFFFFNLLFSLLFILNIPYLNKITFEKNNNPYILLIPKVDGSFEEKKDLIFSGLSLNPDIISVNKVEEKILVKKLREKLNLNSIDEDFIPEVFEIIIKKNKYLQLEKENKKLENILEKAKIVEKKTENINLKNENFLYLFFLSLIFLTLLIILQRGYVKKIKNFLEQARIFGAKDHDLIFNITSGYIFFQFISVFSGYSLVYVIEKLLGSKNLISAEHLMIIIILFCMQNLLGLLSIVLLLKYSLRKLL